MLQFGMLPRELVECRTVEDAHFGVAQRGYAVGAFLAEWPADEIGWKNDTDNLFTAVCGRNAEFKNTGNDICYNERVISLPNKRLPPLYGLLAAFLAESQKFIGAQPRTNGPVTYNTLRTIAHIGWVATLR